MSTVTAPATERPAYGSVEYYTRLLRDDCVTNGGGFSKLDSLTIHFVDDISLAAFHHGADRLGRIRNLLVAAKAVRAELEARR